MPEKKEEIRARLEMPNGAASLLAEMPDILDTVWALWEEENPAAVGLLAQAARTKAVAAEVNRRLGDRRRLYAALTADSYKMRKNAARLAGTLGHSEDAAYLMQALDHEQTRMVRPSQLLALGALSADNPSVQAYLRRYEPEKPVDATQEPHYRQECEALRKARGSFAVLQKHRLLGFPPTTALELRSAYGLGEALAKEAEALGLTVEKKRKNGIRLRGVQPSDLMRLRSWHEVLLPIAAELPYEADTVAALCRKRILPLLSACHEGEPPFAYRWELRGFDRRGDIARELTAAVDTTALQSNPSAYEAEFRLTRQGTRCRLDVKLYTLEDTRFAYRKKALPASIHPATAAGLIRIAAPYLKEGAHVADPCCGSGTLLIERSRYGRCATLTGLDISRTAIEAAKENFRAAGVPGRFKVTDCLLWKPSERADEIFANLPFGHRVGTHESNVALYRSLIKKLPDWLQSGGIAVLYTMELQLLLDCVKEEPRLELLELIRTEAGGLTPGIFLVRNNG